jgi:uncharacterized protein DUF3303
MLYMVIEYFNTGAAPDIYRRARDRGRQLPPGLEYVDSWVDLDYFRCFQLMRTEDRSLFDTWTKAWDGSLPLRDHPGAHLGRDRAQPRGPPVRRGLHVRAAR